MRQNRKPFSNSFIAAAGSLPRRRASRHAFVGEERLTKLPERLLSPWKLRKSHCNKLFLLSNFFNPCEAYHNSTFKALGGKKWRTGARRSVKRQSSAKYLLVLITEIRTLCSSAIFKLLNSAVLYNVRNAVNRLHTMETQSTVGDLENSFNWHKSSNTYEGKFFVFLFRWLHKTTRFHVTGRPFSNISQKVSECGKNINYTLACGQCTTFLFLPHFDVICYLLLYCTEARQHGICL